MTKKVVFHRNRTFEYEGEKWFYNEMGPRGSTDFVYEVSRDSDGRGVNAEFHSVADIRAYVEKCAKNGWPLIDPNTAY